MIQLDAISWRFVKVWQRNFVTFQKIWKINFITPLLEPLLFVAAFGLGFVGLVGEVRYGGASIGYTAFIAPALIASAVMNNAFFETTYASFVRMYYQKTFDGMLATPLSIEEIILAETGHEANLGCWKRLEKLGIVIRWWPVDPTTFTCTLRSKNRPGWKSCTWNGSFSSRHSARSGRKRMSRHWS